MSDEHYERMAEEYVSHTNHIQVLQKIVDDIKKNLTEHIEASGEADERGNQFAPVGRFMLRRQRRESRPVLDLAKVEEWAKAKGIWKDVSKTIEVVDEDALVGYVFDNRDVEGLEAEYKALHTEPKVTYAFMKPVEEEHYDY